MIERNFINQKIKEREIQNFIAEYLVKSGNSKIEIKRTPLGEKIIVHTTKPGLIVGRTGENIKNLTTILKTRFKMENPQIEVVEIENQNLDAVAVADKINYVLERFGPKRFKFTGYDTLKTIMNAGALGAEIVISGRGLPGERAKSWRFSAGHLKKSGDIAMSHLQKAQTVANLKSGTIGIKVVIMLKDTVMPDSIKLKEEDKEIKIEEIRKEQENEPSKKKRTKTDDKRTD